MSDELFLNSEEIENLTGYKYKKLQCDWLQKEKIPFRVNRIGEPKVMRCLFTTINKNTGQLAEELPDFGAI